MLDISLEDLIDAYADDINEQAETDPDFYFYENTADDLANLLSDSGELLDLEI